MGSKYTASQKVNFQFYFNLVKQKEIAWHGFVKLMEDLSYSDVNRLKYLNAILLTELTVSNSDMDRLRYLNVILMNKFKESIQTSDDFEMSENTNLEDSIVDHDLNEENTIITISKNDNFEEEIREISSESENEIEKEEFLRITKSVVDHDLNEDNIEMDGNAYVEVSIVDHDLNDENTIQPSKNENLEVDHDEKIKEISSDSEIEISIASNNERHQNLISQIYEERKCKFCGKSFSLVPNLKKHIHTVHDRYKDFKCDSCGK